MESNRQLFSLVSDEELMLHISKGEVSAFDELYSRYGKRLFVYFTRMLNFNRDLAKDAVQDVFLKIAEAPEKFDRTRALKTWIFSIASNYCKNYYRHREVVRKSEEEMSYSESSSHNLSFVKDINNREFQKLLQEVLNDMPSEKKEAFILKYQEEKTISEIAAIQDCPEGSVKSRLHYTLKILEEKLHMFNPNK